MRRLHKSINGQFGLTLVELIIAFALLGILIIFVIGISTMVIGLTTKMQTRNIALSLAQEKIEDLRSTQNIPPVTVTDTPLPGYTRTVSSSFVKEQLSGTTITATVPFLRKVWVTVTGPVGLGARTVTLETFIQTERPQVAFLFSSNGTDYARSSRDTVLVGSIVDDGHTINKSDVFYWTDLTGTTTYSLKDNIYVNKDCLPTQLAPAILSPGIVYYFKIEKNAPLDINVRATNTIGDYNFQPIGPYPLSSWLHLTVDEDDPTQPVLTCSPSPYVKIGVSDLEISEHLALSTTSTDATSGVGGIFLSIMRTPTTAFWNGVEWIPTTLTTTIYVQMDLNSATGMATYTPAIPVQSNCIPGDRLTVIAYAIDKVIGQKYTYTNSIPTNGSFGADNQAWPSVNANPSMPSNTITLTCATTPTVLSLLPVTGSPTEPILHGSVIPNGAPTNAWFEWGRSVTLGTTTPIQPLGSDAIAHDFNATITPSDPGTYFFRAWAQNELGTASGQIETFNVNFLTP